MPEGERRLQLSNDVGV